jgi:anaphase-promoting complex subunit 2
LVLIFFQADSMFQVVWSLDELVQRVGPIDRTAALKALATWVDLGVLKEETVNSFRLLEVAEESRAGPSSSLGE